MKRLLAATGCLSIGVVLGGCAASRLPTYQWRTPEQAMAIMAERDRQVRTVQAACLLRFNDPDGRSRTLDGAVVAEGNRVRVQAWKFHKTVMDVISTPDSLVVVHELEEPGPGFDAEFLADSLKVITGGTAWMSEGWTPQVQPDGSLLLYWPRGVAHITGDTLLLERIDLAGDRPEHSYRITLAYRDYDGLVWLHRGVVRGPFGEAEIILRDVELNGALNPKAFVPPGQAGPQ